FGLHEGEAPRVGRHAADDEIHAVGQAETLSPDFDECAALDEAAQLTLERRAALARNREGHLWLPRRCGLPELVAARAPQPDGRPFRGLLAAAGCPTSCGGVLRESYRKHIRYEPANRIT